MEYVRFGRTGLKVSKLCLGTMTFGLHCDDVTSYAILDRAAEGGVTFIDTADVYPIGGTIDLNGRAEKIIGTWIRGKRDNFILATKCGAKMGPLAWQRGTSRKHVMNSIDASLKRLRTDYIDLYQVHFMDSDTPMDETLESFDAVLRSGKTRYIGCSNYQAWQLALALGRSEAIGLHKFVSVQPRYSLLFRQNERELFPLCEQEGLAVIPYNPLAAGMLTGKHHRSTIPSEGRFAIGASAKTYTDRYWHDKEFDTVDAFVKIAKQSGIEPTTLAVSWVIANPVITAPIIGASKPEHLDASLAASDLKLDEALKLTLDDLTHEFRMGDALR